MDTIKAAVAKCDSSKHAYFFKLQLLRAKRIVLRKVAAIPHFLIFGIKGRWALHPLIDKNVVFLRPLAEQVRRRGVTQTQGPGHGVVVCRP